MGVKPAKHVVELDINEGKLDYHQKQQAMMADTIRIGGTKSTKMLPKINNQSALSKMDQDSCDDMTEEDEDDSGSVVRFIPTTQLPKLNVQDRKGTSTAKDGRNSAGQIVLAGARYSQNQQQSQALTVQNQRGVQLLSEQKSVRVKKLSMGPLSGLQIPALLDRRHESGSPVPFRIDQPSSQQLLQQQLKQDSVIDLNQVSLNDLDLDQVDIRYRDQRYMPTQQAAVKFRDTPSFLPKNPMPTQNQPTYSFQTVQLRIPSSTIEAEEDMPGSKVTTVNSKKQQQIISNQSHKKASKSQSKRTNVPQNVGDGLIVAEEQNDGSAPRTKLSQVKSLKNLEPEMMQFLYLLKGQEDTQSVQRTKVSQLNAQEMKELLMHKKQMQIAVQNTKHKVLGASLQSHQQKFAPFGDRFSQGLKKKKAQQSSKGQAKTEINSANNLKSSQASNIPKTTYISTDQQQLNDKFIRGDKMTKALKEREELRLAPSSKVCDVKALNKNQVKTITSHIASPKGAQSKIKITSQQQEKLQKKAAQRKTLTSGKTKSMPNSGQNNVVSGKDLTKTIEKDKTNYRSSIGVQNSQQNVQAQPQTVSISAFDIHIQPKNLFLGQNSIQNVDDGRQRSQKPMSRPQNHKKSANNHNSKQTIKPQTAVDPQPQSGEHDLKVYGERQRVDRHRWQVSDPQQLQHQANLEQLTTIPDDSHVQQQEEAMGRMYIKLGVSGTGSSGESQAIIVHALNQSLQQHYNARMGPIAVERSGKVTLKEDLQVKTRTQETFSAVIGPLLIADESIQIAGNANLRAGHSNAFKTQGTRRKLHKQQSEGESMTRRKKHKASKSPRQPKKSASQHMVSELRNEESPAVSRDRRASLVSQKDIDSKEQLVEKHAQKFNLCVEERLISEDINQELLESAKMEEIKAMTFRACKNAYSLPSVGEKDGDETYRLFFRRRHTVERTNLIIVKASDLLVAVGWDFKVGSQERHQTVMIRPDIYRLIAQLLPTNQVAILLDFQDQAFAAWVAELLQEKVKMQVDAIYSFKGRKNPSTLILDITQIINDFRLFSEYQITYKRSLPNQSLFTFVEARHDRLPRSRLLFNAALCYDYMHVSIGELSEDDNDGRETLLDYLITQSVPKQPCSISELTVVVNAQKLQMADLAKQSQQIFMSKRGSVHQYTGALDQAAIIEKEELNSLITEMRQRNSNIAKARSNYAGKRQMLAQKRKVMNNNLRAYGGLRSSVEIDPSETVTQDFFEAEHNQLDDTMEEDEDSIVNVTTDVKASERSSIAEMQAPNRTTTLHLEEPVHFDLNPHEITLSFAKVNNSILTPSSNPVEYEVNQLSEIEQLTRLGPRHKGYQLAMIGAACTPEYSVAKFEWLATRELGYISKGEDVREWLCERQQQQTQVQPVSGEETNDNQEATFTDYQTQLLNGETKKQQFSQFKRIMTEAQLRKQIYMTPTRKTNIL